MNKYILINGELYHHGVKGMKWGVRRYQNTDGSLTPAGQKRYAKDLQKEYKRGHIGVQPFLTSDKYKAKVREAVEKIITDDDKKRISQARTKWLDKQKEANEAEEQLDDIAHEYARKRYDAEIRRAPDAYDTEKAKGKLYDYCFGDGLDDAHKARPDLYKKFRSADPYYDSYQNECRKIADKILGSYGDTKLYESKYYSLSIKDTVGSIVQSMDSQQWRTEGK